MTEQRRDAAGDQALCNRGWVNNVESLCSVFEMTKAMPHWIERAVAAETKIERMKKETEAIRYVVDMLDSVDPQQRRARMHLLEVIKRMKKA
jgi:hypothetical protein